ASASGVGRLYSDELGACERLFASPAFDLCLMIRFRLFRRVAARCGGWFCRPGLLLLAAAPAFRGTAASTAAASRRVRGNAEAESPPRAGGADAVERRDRRGRRHQPRSQDQDALSKFSRRNHIFSITGLNRIVKAA